MRSAGAFGGTLATDLLSKRLGHTDLLAHTWLSKLPKATPPTFAAQLVQTLGTRDALARTALAGLPKTTPPGVAAHLVEARTALAGLSNTTPVGLAAKLAGMPRTRPGGVAAQLVEARAALAGLPDTTSVGLAAKLAKSLGATEPSLTRKWLAALRNTLPPRFVTDVVHARAALAGLPDTTSLGLAAKLAKNLGAPEPSLLQTWLAGLPNALPPGFAEALRGNRAFTADVLAATWAATLAAQHDGGHTPATNIVLDPISRAVVVTWLFVTLFALYLEFYLSHPEAAKYTLDGAGMASFAAYVARVVNKRLGPPPS